MSNYSQTTNFTAKDSLPSGTPAKIIRGADFDVEFGNISTAIATKADTSTLTKSSVGLGNVDNTSDLNKPISTATQAALDAKQGAPDFVIQSFGVI
jgi:2-phospho-L-lactate guanylyltransferase (CobY/MobA/RfbA family)